MLKSGPPELPGLIRASVCKKSSKTPTPITRSLAEMIPCETDCSRPNGLPIATTQSPTLSLSESPKYPNGKSPETSRNLIRALSMPWVVFSGSETSVLMLTTVRLTARINGESDEGGMKLGMDPCPGGSSRQSGAALFVDLAAPGRLGARAAGLVRGEPPSGAPLACGQALEEAISVPPSAMVVDQDRIAARRGHLIRGILPRPRSGIAGRALRRFKLALGSGSGPL